MESSQVATLLPPPCSVIHQMWKRILRLLYARLCEQCINVFLGRATGIDADTALGSQLAAEYNATFPPVAGCGGHKTLHVAATPPPLVGCSAHCDAVAVDEGVSRARILPWRIPRADGVAPFIAQAPTRGPG